MLDIVGMRHDGRKAKIYSTKAVGEAGYPMGHDLQSVWDFLLLTCMHMLLEAALHLGTRHGRVVLLLLTALAQERAGFWSGTQRASKELLLTN